MGRGNLAAVWFINACAVFMWVTPAFAYLGPGVGLTAIGVFLALIVGMIVAFLGFIWYPVKRLLRQRKSASVAASEVREKAQHGSADKSA